MTIGLMMGFVSIHKAAKHNISAFGRVCCVMEAYSLRFLEQCVSEKCGNFYETYIKIKGGTTNEQQQTSITNQS